MRASTARARTRGATARIFPEACEREESQRTKMCGSNDRIEPELCTESDLGGVREEIALLSTQAGSGWLLEYLSSSLP